MVLNDIASLLKEGKKFLVVSHKDPDGDAIGSALALSETLILYGKEVITYNAGPIPDSLSHLSGIEKVVDSIDPEFDFDALLVLDCGNIERVGEMHSVLSKIRPLINIDHHRNNSQFGDLNFVDDQSSSVGEIIYKLMKLADFPINKSIAENIFVSLQSDTGSFRYENTTSDTFHIAGDMVDWGVRPWKISRNIMDLYSLKKLKLLEITLKTIELHHSGMLGLLTVTKEMQSKVNAREFDSEGFVDYPRLIAGVEVGALIKEARKNFFKISLRSNDWVNVSDLARYFGGGGHPRAAAFTMEGRLEYVKREFINIAKSFLEGK
ncbi:MAG: bifunctional oligoribonuclease/PAP phosphatase NrnA [Thermodesulfobacteriota bacterium]|nr:bifunctional oligoribonuclease/PAP phosphatase NrnA [Thermodesulfobacteriota bacterium]